MSKPRIAILINSLKGGGSERTVSHLLKGLRDRYAIDLIMFEDQIDYDLPAGQTVVILESPSTKGRGNSIRKLLRIPSLARQLKRYCEANQIELVLSLLARPNFVACLAKRRGLRSKVLISERTYTPIFHRQSGIAGRISGRLVRWLYPASDLLLPNSEGTKRALKEVYGISGQQRVVHNLLDLEMIEDLAREAPGFTIRGDFIFIHVGSFNFMKGQEMLVEAFAKLSIKGAILILIGDGPLLSSVRKRVHDLGLDARVIFLGHLKNPFQYLSRADCFVFASDFEGFPNAMLEAMACGLPVISTDCLTGPRELLVPIDPDRQIDTKIVRCKSGLLVPVRDTAAMAQAMETMYKDESLRTACADTSQRRSRDYDKTLILEEFAEIIGEQLRQP